MVTATDGTDALAKYAKQSDEIALVLTYMDGPSMIRALKRITPDAKVIAMSGLLNPEVTAELETLGVYGYLPKPFTADKLLTTIAELLNDRT